MDPFGYGWIRCPKGKYQCPIYKLCGDGNCPNRAWENIPINDQYWVSLEGHKAKVLNAGIYIIKTAVLNHMTQPAQLGLSIYEHDLSGKEQNNLN